MSFLQARSASGEMSDEDEDDVQSGDGDLEEAGYPELVSSAVQGTFHQFDSLLLQQIDAQDMETLDTFLPPSAHERKTLADIIFSKLEGKDEEDSVQPISKG